MKFKAIPTTVDGIRFASKKEANRYIMLKILQQAGEISDLFLQPEFPIEIKGKPVFKYIADFCYKDKDGNVIVEDVKGVRTAVYRLKKKIVEATYNFKILET